MKPELHCLGEDKKIVVGGAYGLKLTTMLAAGLTEKASDAGGIKGRTLLKRSKEIIRNCRKALAIVYCHDSPYRNVASTGLLPSGMCLDDYLVYVPRPKMYVVLFPAAKVKKQKGSTVVVQEASITDEAAHNDLENMETIADNIAAADNDALMKTMPENYVFPGLLVFALLGPIVHPDMRRYQSHLIMTRPPIGNDAGGQSSAVSSSTRKRAGA